MATVMKTEMRTLKSHDVFMKTEMKTSKTQDLEFHNKNWQSILHNWSSASSNEKYG